MFSYKTEIEEISFPEEYLDVLKSSIPQLVEALETNNSFVEKGLVDIGSVSDELDRALFFVRWIAESNEVIRNLNLVLFDLRGLPAKRVLLSGCPRDRYYLLLRTFFYEFYRFREIYSRVVKLAASRGYIDKSDVSVLRLIFHEAFEYAIELRNTLVHGTPLWTGERHARLRLVSFAWSKNLGIKDSVTGELWDLDRVLEDICLHSAEALSEEGKRMSFALKKMMKVYADILVSG